MGLGGAEQLVVLGLPVDTARRAAPGRSTSSSSWRRCPSATSSSRRASPLPTCSSWTRWASSMSASGAGATDGTPGHRAHDPACRCPRLLPAASALSGRHGLGRLGLLCRCAGARPRPPAPRRPRRRRRASLDAPARPAGPGPAPAGADSLLALPQLAARAAGPLLARRALASLSARARSRRRRAAPGREASIAPWPVLWTCASAAASSSPRPGASRSPDLLLAAPRRSAMPALDVRSPGAFVLLERPRGVRAGRAVLRRPGSDRDWHSSNWCL